MQGDLRDILNSPFIKPDEVTRISDSFDAILENSIAAMEYIDQILSSDNMKMTDAERAAVLKEKELESKEMVAAQTKITAQKVLIMVQLSER